MAPIIAIVTTLLLPALVVAQFAEIQAVAMQNSTCQFILSSCPGGFQSASKSLHCYLHVPAANNDTRLCERLLQRWCPRSCSPNCCAQANPQSCLLGSNSGETRTDPNAAGCSTVEAVVSACESIYPTFAAMSDQDIAKCVCYDDQGAKFLAHHCL